MDKHDDPTSETPKPGPAPGETSGLRSAKDRLAKLYADLSTREAAKKAKEESRLMTAGAVVGYSMAKKRVQEARKTGGKNRKGKCGPIRTAIEKIVRETGDKSFDDVLDALGAESYLGIEINEEDRPAGSTVRVGTID